MRHTGRPVTTHQLDSRGPEPQRLKQKHELGPIKGQRRSGFCYYIASQPHASVNIANTSDPNGPSRKRKSAIPAFSTAARLLAAPLMSAQIRITTAVEGGV